MALCFLVSLPLARAQAPADKPAAGDPLGEPVEYGLRITPGIARALGRVYAREGLVREYGLPEAKIDAAAELVARRIMQHAHNNDEEKSQEVAESLLAWAFESTVVGLEGLSLSPQMSPEFARRLGRDLPPMMPGVRDLINGVATDVRPMLPLKGQFRLTRDLAMVNVGADIFETNLEKWSRGEVDPTADPFTEKPPEKRDANGETTLLKNARADAENWASMPPETNMKLYLEEARKYYGFDAAQSAAGDSLLREHEERVKAAIGGEEKWRADIRRERFWEGLATTMAGRRYNPVSQVFYERSVRRWEPISALEDEFAVKVEAIATQAQRQAGERRLVSAFREKGFEYDETAVQVAAAALTSRPGD